MVFQYIYGIKLIISFVSLIYSLIQETQNQKLGHLLFPNTMFTFQLKSFIWEDIETLVMLNCLKML